MPKQGFSGELVSEIASQLDSFVESSAKVVESNLVRQCVHFSKVVYVCLLHSGFSAPVSERDAGVHDVNKGVRLRAFSLVF